MSAELVEVSGTVKYQTDDAVLLDTGKDEVWIPKSQIHDFTDDIYVGDYVDLDLPFWLAEKKGLI